MGRISEFLWDEFVYGGHWLSIGAGAISLSLMMLLESKIKWEFLIIAYLLTQTIYTYNHYRELEIDIFSNHPRAEHLSRYKNKLPYLLGFYMILFLTVLILFGSKESIFFGGVLLAIGLLFSAGGKKTSGRIIGLKPAYVSLSWAFSVPFIATYCYHSFDTRLLLLFIFVFLRFFLSTNFFDIKDRESDKKNNIITIPVVIKNEKKLIGFLNLLNIISMLPIIIGVALNILPRHSITLLILFVYSYYYIKKLENKETDLIKLSYIIVDGEFYHWPFLVFIGSILTF